MIVYLHKSRWGYRWQSFIVSRRAYLFSFKMFCCKSYVNIKTPMKSLQQNSMDHVSYFCVRQSQKYNALNALTDIWEKLSKEWALHRPNNDHMNVTDEDHALDDQVLGKFSHVTMQMSTTNKIRRSKGHRCSTLRHHILTYSKIPLKKCSVSKILDHLLPKYLTKHYGENLVLISSTIIKHKLSILIVNNIFD